MQRATQKTRRISARVAPKAYRMIEEMSAITGQSISSVLESSIESHHQSMLAARQEPWKVLQETGLIGSSDGSRDLSARYKSLLTSSLTRKHSISIRRPTR